MNRPTCPRSIPRPGLCSAVVAWDHSATIGEPLFAGDGYDLDARRYVQSSSCATVASFLDQLQAGFRGGLQLLDQFQALVGRGGQG